MASHIVYSNAIKKKMQAKKNHSNGCTFKRLPRGSNNYPKMKRAKSIKLIKLFSVVT